MAVDFTRKDDLPVDLLAGRWYAVDRAGRGPQPLRGLLDQDPLVGPGPPQPRNHGKPVSAGFFSLTWPKRLPKVSVMKCV